MLVRHQRPRQLSLQQRQTSTGSRACHVSNIERNIRWWQTLSPKAEILISLLCMCQGGKHMNVSCSRHFQVYLLASLSWCSACVKAFSLLFKLSLKAVTTALDRLLSSPATPTRNHTWWQPQKHAKEYFKQHGIHMWRQLLTNTT